MTQTEKHRKSLIDESIPFLTIIYEGCHYGVDKP